MECNVIKIKGYTKLELTVKSKSRHKLILYKKFDLYRERIYYQ